jgi:hypothetical protein
MRLYMLSRVHVGITDIERAFDFYHGVMDELSFTLKFFEPQKQWAGWMQPGLDRVPRIGGDGENLVSVTCPGGTIHIEEIGDSNSASCINGLGPALALRMR